MFRSEKYSLIGGGMKKLNIADLAKHQATLGVRVRMYDNDWAEFLEGEIKKQFHEKTAEQIVKMLDTSMNIFRRIVREICSVYREAGTRKITGAERKIQEELDALYNDLHIDQVMQVAHRYSKAATMSFILVRYAHADNGEGKLILRVLAPEQVIVEQDPEEPTKMGLFGYATTVETKDKKNIILWTIYTATERWFADSKGEPLSVDPRTGEIYDTDNVYGIIPAVAFPCEYQVRDFWNINWNRDAAEANIKIGLLNTYMNYLVKTQSFKQIVINSDHVSDEVKTAILDPLFPLLLAGGGSASTLDLNTQLGAIDQVIQGKVAAIANNYGISAQNFTLTTQAASGFSLKIANQSLQDIRAADIPLCSMVEQSLYRAIATVAEAEGIASFDPDATVAFNPGEFSWPEEWATERNRWEFEFANGIASPVDYIVANDPQLTREDAIAKIVKRQDEMKMLKPKMSPWEMIAAQMSGAETPAIGGSATSALAVEAMRNVTPPKEAIVPEAGSNA
jgi:hypothetical protein